LKRFSTSPSCSAITLPAFSTNPRNSSRSRKDSGMAPKIPSASPHYFMPEERISAQAWTQATIS
jgi:hypothetical protein